MSHWKVSLPILASALFAVPTAAQIGGGVSLPAKPILQTRFRTIDGTLNNFGDPSIGSVGIELIRLAPSDYGDGLDAMAGATRPSPRAVSNAAVAQAGSIPAAADVSDFVWQWGQFLDHDIDLSDTGSEVADIAVPMGDPFFDPLSSGTAVIGFTRSEHHASGPGDPREQLNVLTAWIDGSNVYGSDAARALELRTLDGTGKLRTSAGDLLPFNTGGFPNAPTALDPTLFLAGDVRANEQIGLAAMHTLFVREHNSICDRLIAINGNLSDEDYYQAARAIVGAEMQKITYDEFLPVVLGAGALPPYTGYDPGVDASIANEFSTAAYRFGHTMLSPVLQRLDSALADIPEGPISLADAFFNPSAITDEGGIEPILRGLATQRPQEVDQMIVDPVRNFLFGPPGAGGFDLASLNIQRGRDHGLPSYNDMRAELGFGRAATFADITSDPNVQARLASVYASVDDVDLWVGGLAEDDAPGSLLGPTFTTIIADQFQRLRDGDAFFYKLHLSGRLLGYVENQTLGKIIKRNTPIGNELSDHVFVL